MTRAEKAARDKRLQAVLKQTAAERKARGQCRHCGGPVPCWSAFGDSAVGKRKRLTPPA